MEDPFEEIIKTTKISHPDKKQNDQQTDLFSFDFDDKGSSVEKALKFDVPENDEYNDYDNQQAFDEIVMNPSEIEGPQKKQDDRIIPINKFQTSSMLYFSTELLEMMAKGASSNTFQIYTKIKLYTKML